MTTNNTADLLLRLSLGTILLAHGLLKVLVFTLSGTAGYFASLGLPEFLAYIVTFGEIGLGAALIAGVYTRLAAVASVPILLGATWVHIGNGWVFSNQGGGWEFPALLVVLAVVVALQNSKAYSLAYFFGTK